MSLQPRVCVGPLWKGNSFAPCATAACATPHLRLCVCVCACQHLFGCAAFLVIRAPSLRTASFALSLRLYLCLCVCVCFCALPPLPQDAPAEQRSRGRDSLKDGFVDKDRRAPLRTWSESP